MKLLISQLHEGENPFQFESSRDAWMGEVLTQVEAQGYRLESPIAANVRLTKLEPDYYMKGQLAFDVQQTCARCAEMFKLPIKHQFDVALAHINNVKVRKVELAEESEELDINFFEGNEIDLSPIIKEQFFLSIPYQSLCNEACKGICQHCGQNLNLKTCACDGSLVPKPFSVLKDLKF